MAKFSFEVAVAFATQTAEGTYNATLDGITTSLTGAQGLVLGHANSGVRQSGLTLTIGREYEDKAFYAGSYSRAISNFLYAKIPTFSFAMPFCGNRGTASTPPVDGDAVPITGLDALLEGAGLEGTAWGTGVGHRYVFASTNPISALVYYFGNRLELLDCRTTLSILFEAGKIPILTATVEVGSVKDHSVAALPTTLTYTPQDTVTAPKVIDVGNAWQDTRGFSTATLDISPTYEDVGDSNNDATGFVKEQTDRETKLTATLFADDTVDKGYEYSQLIEATQGNLDQLSFQVGDSMTDASVVEAVQIVIPDPELVEAPIAALGSKAGHEVNLIARGSAANTELEIIFR